jgi:hypothetical protein
MSVKRSVQRRSAKSRYALVLVLAIVGALLPTAFVPAHAATLDPEHVSFTLEGCRGTAGILPDSNGKFICHPDTGPGSLYTTGNLGGGWNELDLVPHRVTADAGNAAPSSQTYKIAIVADNFDAGHPGYDVISVPELNTTLSSASCTAPTVGPQTVLSPGLGGIDQSIYRFLTITQPKNTVCVYDYFQRLALGSHLFPGSSLHSNLANQDLGTAGIGARDVSIPVKEIAPQSINKTMAASQGSDHIWTLTKGPAPATLTFENTCGGTTGDLQKSLSITVSWTKGAATPGGPITVITNIYATNPAHRTITVNVTDEIRSGTTVLDTANSGDIDVPPNTANFLILTHQTTVPAGTTNLNDIATATYTDKVTGIPVPGTTTATASATPAATGPEKNATALITDVESITGTGLTFSVDSVGLGSASGTFTLPDGPDAGSDPDPYVLGTPTTGPLTWTSSTQNGSGFVQFNKTVYVDQPRNTTGTLSDTATLTGSDGFTASASASTAISATALFTLTINKTVPDILTGSETASFTFDICNGPCTFDGGGNVTNGIATRTITFSAGQTSKSTSVANLTVGTYGVHERPATGWGAQPDQQRTFSSPSTQADCTKSVTFENTFSPAQVRVQKFTNPTGSGQEANWVFKLTGPGIATFEQATTTDSNTASPGSDVMSFGAVGNALQQGTYTITETLKTGWDLTLVTGTPSGRITGNVSAKTCSFTVDYTADAGLTFQCNFTNVQRGSVTVIKTQNGGTPTNAYTFCLSGGPDSLPATNCLTTNSTNGGTLNFGTLKASPPNYTLCEKAVPAGTHSTLEDQGGVVNPTTGDVCLSFALGAGEDKVFRIDNTFPQGGQRTIGYWRNWNSCSGTGNDRVAMAAKTGNHLMDEFLPQTLGQYTVDTCAKGLAVLQNPSMKYAENGTAAQLLGAKLNVAAGAGTCPAALTAISTADNLLTQIGYAGPPSAIVGTTHPLRSQFVAVHSTLDQYNNGLLC